jgi:dienelactone hydrolase
MSKRPCLTQSSSSSSKPPGRSVRRAARRIIYKGANHGFHNDTTPGYDDAAAKLAWRRTLEWFGKYLS